ncbi:MAG TPA: reverse transcriptase domain-containing protein [Terrimicrobiaceae bacterium]
MGYEGPKQLRLSRNLVSACKNPGCIQVKLEKDLRRGRVLLAQPNFPFISSPLGLVPKHDGGLRRIHHLSHPKQQSVNDHIPHNYASIQYITVDKVFDLVIQGGRDCLIVKKDIKDAFRIVPIAAQQRWLFGFEWKGEYYQEACLPFGLATAPVLFNLFAEAFEWMLKHLLQWSDTTHYLDDFIRVISKQQTHTITQAEEDYLDLTLVLGIPCNTSKDRCGTTVEVLGIEIDTSIFEARLSAEKLSKAITVTEACLNQVSLSLREAQRLCGFLNFCCKVVRIGRNFMSSLWEFIAAFDPGPPARRRINFCLREDIRWWHTTLPLINGILFFDDTNRRTVQVFTDACLHGLGGFYYSDADDNWKEQLHIIKHSQSFSTRIPALYASEHINVLELQAILFAFQAWAINFHRCRVVVNTDNKTAYNGLLSQRLRGRSNSPLRQILCIAAQHDITVEPRWLSSEDNLLADALSRHDSTTVANLCPHWQNSRSI